MYYVIKAVDKKDSLELRLQTRPTHLEYLNAGDFAAKLFIAGPLLDDAEKPKGSLLIIEAETRKDAEDFAAGDPYAKAGLFAETTIEQWNWVIGKP